MVIDIDVEATKSGRCLTGGGRILLFSWYHFRVFRSLRRSSLPRDSRRSHSSCSLGKISPLPPRPQNTKQAKKQTKRLQKTHAIYLRFECFCRSKSGFLSAFVKKKNRITIEHAPIYFVNMLMVCGGSILHAQPVDQTKHVICSQLCGYRQAVGDSQELAPFGTTNGTVLSRQKSFVRFTVGSLECGFMK